MNDKSCPQCNGLMKYKKGISKKGKPYEGWFCENKSCGAIEWVDTPKKPQTPLKTQPDANKGHSNGMSKQDWKAKDAGISALALCKIMAMAGVFDKDKEEHDKMLEQIYSDYVSFKNRITPNETAEDIGF